MVAGPFCPRCDVEVASDARFCPSCGAPLFSSAEAEQDQLLARLRLATVGEYDVLRQIGHGGMACVYLAWDLELARHVAIKVLLPELAHRDSMSLRFLQEARTAANLDDHPSVVRVYRAKESGGLRYFVMKYVEGCSLEQLLRTSGAVAPEVAADVLQQIALALQHAHDRGVVHRDVKPGNVLLSRYGGVVVTDFGIAKVAEIESLTRTGMAIGTPHYMSPEQWCVEPLTPASDQYSLGVVAWHMLAGTLPFDGTQYVLQQQHLNAPVPPLPEHCTRDHPELEAIVRRMLAKEPGDRFPDLRSVAGALADLATVSPVILTERLAALIPAAMPPESLERATPVSPIPVGRGLDPTVARGAARHTPRSSPRVGSSTPPVPAPAVSEAPAATGVTVAPSLTVFQPPRPADAPGDVPATAASEPRPDAPPALDASPTVPAPSRARVARPYVAGATLAALAVAGWSFATRREPRLAVAARSAAEAPHGAVRGADSAAARPAGQSASRDTTATTATTASGVAGDTTAPPTQRPGPGAVAAASGAKGAGQPPDPEEARRRAEAALVPTSLVILGAPELRLAAGDSARVVSRVDNPFGERLRDARVQWSTSDSTRVVWRRGYVVALAPGGPVAVTARSDSLRRQLRVTVGPRRSAARDAAALDAAELASAVEPLLAALRARDTHALEALLASSARDGTPTRGFLDWMAKARRPSVDGVSTGTPTVSGQGGAVAVRVAFRWKSGGGPFARDIRKDAVFHVALTRADGRWRAASAELSGKFPP